MRRLQEQGSEGAGMAIVFVGLLLLTAAFAVGIAAPHVDGTVAGPFMVPSR